MEIAAEIEFSDSRKIRLLGSLAIALLTLAAFWPTFHNGYIWDDDFFVTANNTLRNLSGLGVIWMQPRVTHQYYPATFTTLWLEYHCWGLMPVGYHVINMLYQICDALLLWRLLVRLRVPGAFIAAAIFATHPVYVESVAWISELKNTQSTFFYLVAFHAYLTSGLPRLDDRKISWRWYGLAVILFILALSSKTVTSSLPAAILVVLWWKRGRVGWRDLWPLIPMFVTGIALGLFTAHLEKNTVGASGQEFQFSVLQRCIIAGRAIWFYLFKLLWPANLMFIYPHWSLDWRSRPWLVLFPISAAMAIAGLWLMRRKWGRGPIAAALLFVGTLFPALGFVNVFPMRYSFVADHFQYLASIAMIALAAAGLAWVAKKIGRPPAWIGAGALLAIYIALSRQQCGIYQDSETLWRHNVAKNPNSWMVQLNLGNALLAKGGDDPEAEKYLERASDLGSQFSDPWWCLGVAEARQGHYQQAIELYQHALKIWPALPAVYTDMGNAQIAMGHPDEAIKSYRTAISYDPGSADAHFNLAVALEKENRQDEALREYVAAVHANPWFAKAHYNLANCLMLRHDPFDAETELRSAIALNPQWADAHANLGTVLVLLGQPTAAADEYRLALQLDPNLEAARAGLQRLAGQAAPPAH